MPFAPPSALSSASSAAGGASPALDGDGVPAFEFDLDDGRPVGRVLRRHRARVDVLLGLDRRIFQRLALRTDVQQVRVPGERRLAPPVPRDGDLVLLGERDQGGPGGQVPFAPRRDHPDVRLERIVGELETHLVVAFARGSVGDGVRARPAGDLDLSLGDQGTGDRRTQQIKAFVERVGAEHGEDEIADEFLAQVLDVDLLDPEHFGLGPSFFEFIPLADVGREGHDLAVVGLLKPFEDHRGIEPARVGEHNLLHVSRHGFLPRRPPGRLSLADLSWPHAAMMSRPRGARTGDA